MTTAEGEPAAKRARHEGDVNGVFSRHTVCLVLDYGSQYTQLIARRVRENGVLSMLMPGDASLVRPRGGQHAPGGCMHGRRGGARGGAGRG